MNNKLKNNFKINKDVIMVFIAMISTLLVVIGTSYAVFNMVIISNKEHTVTSGNLTITFLETSQFIALNNASPMTDIEGLNTKPYNITITNTGTINAKYRIYLEDDKTIKNIVPKNLLKISYKEGTSNYTTPSLISSLEEESIIVKDRSLNVGNSINYEFKIWLDINATNSEQGKTYKSKVVVESVQSLGDYSDTISPIIKLNGELNTNISKGGTFTDSGVLSVEDDKDKTLTTSNVTKTYEYFNGITTTSVANINTNNTGVYFIYYKIKDNANNEGLVVRTVSVNDNTPPTITLIGNASIELLEGNKYIEPGFTAVNSKGGNINNKVITSGFVNELKVGNYIIKYIAVDDNNQMTAITREIIIKPSFRPDLSEGLILVKYDGSNWVKADENNNSNNWYNYQNKEWANAVSLVGTKDYSGNNYDGILYNGAEIREDSEGINALILDGKDDYVQLPKLPASIDFSSGFTVEFTATWDALNRWSRIFEFGNGPSTDNILVTNADNTNNLDFAIHGNANLPSIYDAVSNGSIDLKIKTKFKVVVLKLGTNNYKYTIYKNNVEIYTQTNTNYITNVDRNINYIGKSNCDGNLTFNGKIYNLKITLANNDKVIDYDFTRYGNEKKEITNNSIIPMEKVAAMYVWIPRYSYKLWNVNNEGKPEQEIDIKFVHRDVIENGSTNGTYLTHPAFWWDNNSNGIRENNEELKGIWVGKFETTGDANAPTIKPNLTSLRNQNVSTQFITAQKFKNYGLSNINTDAHMMKNMEWGAVAYLSHSKYGINNEIRINNSSTYITGCAATNAPINNDPITNCFSGCQNAYNTLVGNLASTTGNITGIYDMSGGSWEYTMGNVKNINGNFSSSKSGFTTPPNKKYYEIYEYGTSVSTFNRGQLGDGSCETLKALNIDGGWYQDFVNFPCFLNNTYDFVWTGHGGECKAGIGTGAFYFGNHDGGNYPFIGFRSVIVK